MKTQINTLVTGTTHLGTHGIVGTNRTERMEITNKVIAENPESMTIKFKGRIITLVANWSRSRKSVHYTGPFPIDLYSEMFGEFGIPKVNPSATLLINGDMTANVQTNSKFRNSGKVGYQTIKESDITIL